MIGHRCRRCIWWDNVHPSIALVKAQLGKTEMGFCRKHRPSGLRLGETFYGVQIVTDADEFCGEFRGEK